MDEEKFGVLPENFRFAHLFCQRLSDRLVDIHSHMVSGPFWNIQIEFRSVEEAEEFAALTESEDVIAWLEKNEYSETLGFILSIQLFVALLGDLCQFVYEALGSSARGKTTVAFALFRKPLKDNLFYLEWLLAEPSGMMTAFFNDEAERFALHSVASREKGVAVSRAAIAKLLTPIEFDPELIWQMRFDKTVGSGLEQYWHRALHLITHHRHVRTRPRDMNFIFGSRSERSADWEDLYTSVPLLLYYTVEVCEALVGVITDSAEPDWLPSWLHRGVGLAVWFRESQRWNDRTGSTDFRIADYDLNCVCGFRFERERFVRRFYVNKEVKCPKCQSINTAESFLKHATARTERNT